YHARRIGGPDHKKRFVMKKLLNELQADPIYVERFKNEARVTSGLSHPHIIETYEIGRHDGQWYIAMEYLPGRDLGNVLNRLHHFDVQCPVEIALEIGIAVGHALDHVHSLRITDETGARIVHRDVNPANVMMTWDGRIKLLDFGLAKDPEQDLTGGGEMVGKLMYQPPEAIKGGKPSPQWDVYAVGLLMFELLSGRAPFGGVMSSSQLMARIVAEELDDLRELNDTVPDSVADFVKKATAKDLNERFATMEEVVAALEAALEREVAGRGDVKTFMRVLYQEDDKVPARVQLGQAAPRRKQQNRKPPSQKDIKTLPRPARRGASDSRKNAMFILAGVVVLGLVAGAMYWMITSRTGLDELDEIDVNTYIETGIRVRCRAGRVLLDGVQLGRCPSVATPTSVGRYTVRVEDGETIVERSVEVASGQLVDLDLRNP
ncbi:MAG: serine/threonine-protein kinase, partial [Myxococcota bacterium]